MTNLERNRRTLQYLCVALLFLLINVLFLHMIWSMVLAVVMGAIFTGLAYGLYTRLQPVFGGRDPLAAAAALGMILLFLILPMIVMANVVADQAVQIGQSAKPHVDELLHKMGQPDTSLDWIPFWDQLQPYREQITEKLGEAATAVSSMLVHSLSAATEGAVRFFFSLFLMLYSMHFFLVEGVEIRDRVLRLLPLQESDKRLLLDKFVTVSRATIKGTLVIGIVQGGLAGAAFAVVGIEGAAFWGTVMAVLSIIPGIGTALVWVPAVLYLFVVGQTVPAVGLLLWCAVVVGTADNVLRPLLVGKDTEMPDLLVMLSTFGGLGLFGAVGLVLGPVIAALFLAVWRIYSDTFGEFLTAPEESSPEPVLGEPVDVD